MFWFVIALQAMAPFIHAHAGAVQLNHADFLHLHQGAHSDAAWHGMASDEHGAEVEVAQSMPLRHDALGTIADAPTLAHGPGAPRPDTTERSGAGLAAPPLHPALPDHSLPHALAPPFA